MKKNEKLDLEEKFKNRISFELTERKIYSHDIASIPSLIKPLLGSKVAEAVVQPISEEELIFLAKWATKNKTALIPRGKATSGYGGVLPLKKSIIVDFFRMNKIINIDKINNTATVQPGIIWEKLDKELKKHGLSLRLYPSSYPGSTVGGWLAQGGAGIGSYEFGFFKENVQSVKVVLPNGSVEKFEKENLDLISEAEGITGFISEITINVMPLEELEVLAVSTPDEYNLQKFLSLITNSKIPIWSVLFINPKMAELKNQTPSKQHIHLNKNSNQKTDEINLQKEVFTLPKSYISTIAFFKKNSNQVKAELDIILNKTDSKFLSNEIAQHEWDNRFNTMVVKRLGPSMVPSEFIIPLDKLGDTLTEIAAKVRQPIIKEGMVIKRNESNKSEVVILGFIPSDERKFSYNFVFALALTILKIAQKNNGKPYSTGLYFANKAEMVLGAERFQKLLNFKNQIDPLNIFNPNKVVGLAKVNLLMKTAEVLEPIIKQIANKITTKIGERFYLKDPKDIPADVAWFAYSCSQCGYCVPECDQFYGRGWESQSPRGRWYWLRLYLEGKEKWSQKMVDSFLACTTCELCNLKCSVNLPIESSWMKMRGLLIHDEHRMTIPPFEMMAAALNRNGDIWAGYRENRDKWFPQDLKDKHYNPNIKKDTVYFAGCTASYVENDIAMSTVRLLDIAGVDFDYLGPEENCCGIPMLVAGKWDDFINTMKKNIESVKRKGATTVIASCPACDMMWRSVYVQWAKKLGLEYNIKTKHYSEVIAEKIRNKEFQFPENPKQKEKINVTWHDSCHIGRASGVYEPPREIINAIPNVNLIEMENNKENAHCCGSVLTLIKEPSVAAEVGKIRLDEAVECGAEKVLSLCPCCEFQFRVTKEKKNINLEIIDLARFASTALGYEFPEPNPEVQRQWAVFEAMIALMSPEGFASVMKSMWPDLLAAMPLKMGSMMKIMGKIPGLLKIMKPLFPVLFPILLPKMMPKVMGTMLKIISDKIPMPEYMLEQMPQLMPKVMDNLMPHMIGDVIPLVADDMINYLTNKK